MHVNLETYLPPHMFSKSFGKFIGQVKPYFMQENVYQVHTVTKFYTVNLSDIKSL